LSRSIGKQLQPFTWTNRETKDLVQWLIEDIGGASFAEALCHIESSTMEVDTPTRTLGEGLRNTIEYHIPLGLSQEWLDAVDWNQVAQYLILNLD